MRQLLERRSRPWLALAAVWVLVGCSESAPVVEPAIRVPAIREFVGSNVCLRCHASEGEKWRGSHHDRAMEEGSSESILGRFDGSMLRHFDRTWRFLIDREEHVVELEEPGRATQRMPVAFTFGVHPLQQLLVERPNGRMQALPLAWDARTVEAGGQRWIDLQPDEPITREDPLHWERLAFNWNSQCASCHSTNLDKGYDATKDRFETRWSELDVGCEACHGPGSEHVSIQDRDGGGERVETGFDVSYETWNPDAWHREPPARIASRVGARTRDSQIETCAPCHSRRMQIVDAPPVGAPFLDGYRPSLLSPDLYFEDGQIREEVYVWGSFLQSRMAMAGVRCNDCHDPHSLTLRREGDALCAGCHDREAYETKGHHGHALGTEAANCVTCHMPARIYMQVDGRRDHSFPIPRPERSASLAVPNACATCHEQRDADWAATAIDTWRSAEATRPRHWSDALLRGREARADPERWLEIALEDENPPLVRANAWSRYAGEFNEPPPLGVLQQWFREATSLERLALIQLARRLQPELRGSLVQPYLEDERLAIRAAAAEALVDLPAELWRPAQRARLARALRDYRATLEANAERPEAQVGLGLLAVAYGEPDEARTAYQRAIELAPYFVPAYANLADLERALGRNAEAVALLRRAVELAPDEVLVRHALGLALHRAGRSAEGLVELARAARSAPEEPRLTLGWALALDAAEQRSEAISVLAAAVDRGDANGQLLEALVTLLRDEGRLETARARARAWLQAAPGDPRARALLMELETKPSGRVQPVR